MKKQWVMSLAAAVVLTLFAWGETKTLGATMFLDTEGHWAEEAINRWSALGVVNGYEGYFRPQDNITIAEFSAILDNLMRYNDPAEYDLADYADISPDDWYFGPMLRLVHAGVIKPDWNNNLRPGELLTRAEEAVMLAKAFHLTPVTGASGFTDNSDISIPSRPYVKAMHENGYITGYKEGEGFAFRPNNPVTRAEAVAMINVMVDAYINEDGSTHTGGVTGNVLVAADGVTLSLYNAGKTLYISAGCGDITLDDVSAKNGAMILGGRVDINNSRFDKMYVDGFMSVPVVTTSGATVVETLELRSACVFTAGQNEYSYIRNTVIPKDFPEGQTVTLSGNFRVLSNNTGDKSIVKGGNFNTGAITFPEQAAVSSFRPTNSVLDVTLTSKSLGTAHFLILKNTAPREPSDDEIMDVKFYDPPLQVFDYGSFRVYPNNTETFRFTGANQTLGIDNQGHIVYVIIEDEKGSLTRLKSEPSYFKPGVEHVFVAGPTEIYVNLDNYFPDGAGVEDSYELFITTKGVERQVSFRAFSMFPDDYGHSMSFRLLPLYGARIEEGDTVTLRPRNDENGGVSHARVRFDDVLLFDFKAVISLKNLLEITAEAKRRCDVFYALTTEYLPDYYKLAYEISAERLPVDATLARYGNVMEATADFYTSMPAFTTEPDYYFLYLVARDAATGKYSEVGMYIIKP